MNSQSTAVTKDPQNMSFLW